VDIACILLELIFIRDGSFYVDLPCFAHDIIFSFTFVYHVIFIFLYFFFIVLFEYDFIINIYIYNMQLLC